MTPPPRVGDNVVINGRVSARVSLASPTGRSIIVDFEAVIDVIGGGVYIGQMPLFETDGGEWIELGGAVIQLSRPS